MRGGALAVAFALLLVSPATAQTPEEAAPPPPDPATIGEIVGQGGPIQVGGRWSGTVFRGSRRMKAEWNVRQAGSLLTIQVTETLIGGNGFARYEARGESTSTGITFQGTTWLTRREEGWCLPAGAMTLREEGGQTVLSGRERRNTVATGCPGRQNSLRLVKQ